MEAGQTAREGLRPNPFGPDPGEPLQLEFPATNKLQSRRARVARRKRYEIPERLVFGAGDFDLTVPDEGREPPKLYTRDGTTLKPATECEIFMNSEALLVKRFRRGMPIERYPKLLRRMLQENIGSHRRVAFFAFYLDSKGCLIQMAELFRGTISDFRGYIKEVMRHAMECDATQVLCARTDPDGHAEPNETDMGFAKRLRVTFDLFDMLLTDYVIVGMTITSFVRRGYFTDEAMRGYD